MTNIVVIVGNVGQDPTTRATQGGNVTSISVATERRWNTAGGEAKKETEWHKVTCFNGLGTNVAKYVRKGSKVSIQGRLHYSSWAGPDGVTKYGVEILADTVGFLTPAPKAGDTPKREQRPAAPAQQPAMAGGHDDLDDDVPF